MKNKVNNLEVMKMIQTLEQSMKFISMMGVVVSKDKATFKKHFETDLCKSEIKNLLG
jgi:hypothetical protein